MIRRWMVVVGADAVTEEVTLEIMVVKGDCVGFGLELSG